MVFKSLPNLLSTLTTISKTTHDLLSTILIAQDSHGDNPLYASTALTLASSFAPPALAAITIHQALETNTQLRQISSHLGTISDTLARDNALRVASEFPTLVYNMLQHKIKSEPSSIWYLVYHPDTIWRHHFEDLVLNRGVLGERFIGIFGSLDAVVIYMQAMRKAGVGRGGGGEGEVHFRLLVPAYYPITVETPVRFPVESIEPFDVYCDVHNGVPLVSMFLPGVREGELGNVGLWKPQRGFWEQLFGIGSGQDENPRLLGMQLLHDGENVNMDGLAIHDQSIDGDKIGQSGEQVQVQEKMREVLAEDPVSGDEYIYEEAVGRETDEELERASTVASAGETEQHTIRHHSRRHKSRHSTASQAGSVAGSDFYSVYSWTSGQSSRSSGRRHRRRHTSRNGSDRSTRR
ncbi:hypothetical protein CBS63078_9959 [Aspergillus niger]|uniref:Uncharacterized protein n=1 Tax=Aspergillus niger (strain ATCC 1015 / CBS 113.46 / FGSC A1144 / LSHB Ac4 / NCTC 3858a / NRRL 328 / USDA 3528.7) TaxID=380704 RepID=G3XPD7_ASPNA|nr:uncharacterized protein BO96DRAFT_444429 [Aspergillus niger CBS 101883]EHA27745.1 hypothetical protein ASPNIDRAFT_41688 [Aspergillus niger ATCC 1015]KAI2834817.1 hypothetical protein CBS11350_10441 [Aspergillus niger]KAI2843323.1 hypothetical protein CBS12448_10117 [Aspergillus niger]KAI2890599.1 hypothetical protein CBS63078_9959 [Aspergillus niger]KAI2920553.1 hypothetical protein CBS147371_3238 [Aspergillus niger]